MRKIAYLAFAAAITATAAAAATRHSAPPARLTMAQARTIALKAAPGTIVDAEYEKEGGGWRYSFDIRQAGRKDIHEIGVDARDGHIVEDGFERTGAKN